MRLIGTWGGIFLGFGAILLSAAMNARYGMSVARNGFDQWIMVAVALLADGGKAFSWIYCASALKRREVLPAIVALFVFGACLTYALSGSLGFAAMTRAQSTASTESEGSKVSELDLELRRLRAKLSQLGAVEPSGAIERRIEAMRQDRRFAASKNCTDATLEATRNLCAGIARLQAEEKKSQAASVLEVEIKLHSAKRDALGVVAVAEKGDFQAALIAQLTNLHLATIQLSLSLVVVVMVELSACFFFWLAINYGEAAASSNSQLTTQPSLPTLLPSSPIPADLVEFVETHIDLVDGGTVSVDEIVAAYKNWCVKKMKQPLTDAMIALGLEQFCRVGGLAQMTRDDLTYIVGVVLKPAPAVLSRGQT